METPTIHRWELGRQMRQLREEAGITVKAAAAEIEASVPTMSKIESGRQGARLLYVKLLGVLYRCEPAVLRSLIELAKEANQPEWFASLTRHVPDWFKLYLGYESAASRLQVYSAELVDGLLRTREYAREVIGASSPAVREVEIDGALEVQCRRQGRLRDGDSLDLHVILNEAALRRVVGSPELMRAQVEHILRQDRVTVQVLPFGAGAHPAMAAPFSVLGFDDHPGMDCVYLENGRGALYLEGEGDLARYRWSFERLSELALSPLKSRQLLATVAEQL